MDVRQLATDLMRDDRVALGRAITLVESSKDEHRHLASELLSLCAPHLVPSHRLGITGVPGVGKSTFIETMGVMLANSGRRVAVLAVDPSSDVGKGSILGDRTRMERLSAHSNAFIRPTPSGGSLGGVARRTRETMLLCEAAGYDTVIVETVGVGQSETAVHGLVDMFVLLVLATAGDELQGIKRGIMEMADMVVINKDDGNNAVHTAMAKASYHHALHLFPAKESGWTVPVLSCSALEGKGVEAVLDKIDEFFRLITVSGHLAAHRSMQNVHWMEKTLEEELLHQFMQQPQVNERISELKKAVLLGELSPFDAARKLVSGL
ncbi:MAG: methylmalonyl Co-A mutase-associated GTPase MeaB [Flavobacteriales bacterium]|nr:methylmalonyl Co-A mutase-associated GTPase MeaB [Flavobacteriales bacterium]